MTLQFCFSKIQSRVNFNFLVNECSVLCRKRIDVARRWLKVNLEIEIHFLYGRLPSAVVLKLKNLCQICRGGRHCQSFYKNVNSEVVKRALFDCELRSIAVLRMTLMFLLLLLLGISISQILTNNRSFQYLINNPNFL